jgi:hypothetical protein
MRRGLESLLMVLMVLSSLPNRFPTHLGGGFWSHWDSDGASRKNRSECALVRLLVCASTSLSVGDESPFHC